MPSSRLKPRQPDAPDVRVHASYHALRIRTSHHQPHSRKVTFANLQPTLETGSKVGGRTFDDQAADLHRARLHLAIGLGIAWSDPSRSEKAAIQMPLAGMRTSCSGSSEVSPCPEEPCRNKLNTSPSQLRLLRSVMGRTVPFSLTQRLTAACQPAIAVSAAASWKQGDPAIDGIGLIHVTQHRLMAIFATLHANTGTPLRRIQSLTRHRSILTLMRYIEDSEAGLREAQEIVAGRVGLAAPPKPKEK